MKPAAIAVLLAALLSLEAAAGDLTASAELAYQNYEYGNSLTSGFRQTYDLQLRKALNATTTLRFFLRADDYVGDTGLGSAQTNFDTRQLQPGAEILINAEKLTLSARSEVQRIDSSVAGNELERSLERTTGQAEWRPDRLPVFNFFAHRYVNEDDALDVDLTDESVGVRAYYPWRGLWVAGEGREDHSADLIEGYDRTQTTRGADLGYSKIAFGERLSIDALATVRRSETREEGLGDIASSIPTPVVTLRASNGIDDTPNDNRDRPLSPNPALTDANLSASAGISIGPDGQSFHNIALEFARLEKVDEIRIIVRDTIGNPLQTGGGAVQWDVWTSEDGLLWTQLPGTLTSFDAALSLYSVEFEQLTKRWIKVVNFGVNVNETLVTEIDAFYHKEIAPGGVRESTQDDYLGLLNISANPTRRLSLSYSGSVTSNDQEYAGLPFRSSEGQDHFANARYLLLSDISLRGEFVSRRSEELDGIEESTLSYSGFVDWVPTSQLRLTAELTRQDQTFEGKVYTLDTQAFHANSWMFPSLSILLSGGIQSETPETGEGDASRKFLNLTSSAHLTRSMRMLLTGSLQRVTQSEGYASRFLGAGRDDRVSADFVWRPGRPLAVTASVGWFRGESRDGTTGRLRVEWYPFSDGTLLIGGFVDEDVDTASDREATRAQFLTRWSLNRYARFELNYTAVSTKFESTTNEQRTLFATITLTN